MSAKLFGSWGEAKAAQYLRDKRYSIVSMGYHTRFGEIDIIAQNRKYIVFVEVKTRKSADFAMPREYVTRDKMRRIKLTASLWIEENTVQLQPRFDVIEVFAQNGTNTEHPIINHIENAF